MGWGGHGLWRPWACRPRTGAAMGWSGHRLRLPWALMAIFRAVHVLSWTKPGLAIGLAGHGLGLPFIGLDWTGHGLC